jgi:hypothetical protein
MTPLRGPSPLVAKRSESPGLPSGFNMTTRRRSRRVVSDLDERRPSVGTDDCSRCHVFGVTLYMSTWKEAEKFRSHVAMELRTASPYCGWKMTCRIAVSASFFWKSM